VRFLLVDGSGTAVIEPEPEFELFDATKRMTMLGSPYGALFDGDQIVVLGIASREAVQVSNNVAGYRSAPEAFVVRRHGGKLSMAIV
jgi:hypothetical protein